MACARSADTSVDCAGASAVSESVARYSDRNEKTFIQWFWWEINRVGLNMAAIRVAVPVRHEQVLAFDPIS